MLALCVVDPSSVPGITHSGASRGYVLSTTVYTSPKNKSQIKLSQLWVEEIIQKHPMQPLPMGRRVSLLGPVSGETNARTPHSFDDEICLLHP